MAQLIPTPTRVTAAGTPPKQIDEYVGNVNNGDSRLSIARMRSPSGWLEPGQRPEFDEYTLVLHGTLNVQTELNRDFLASEAGERLKTRIPQRRFGLPDELDGPLLLLASDAGSFITGSVLCADGGHLVSSL